LKDLDSNLDDTLGGFPKAVDGRGAKGFVLETLVLGFFYFPVSF
jgi:hypothetical protein